MLKKEVKKHLKLYYPDQPVSLIAFGEVADYPNLVTRNLNRINYISELEKSLKQAGLQVSISYFQSLFFQKTKFIQRVIEINPLVKDLKVLLQCSVSRDSISNTSVRKRLQRLYQIQPEDDIRTIQSLLKSPNAIVLRTSACQDLMLAIGLNQDTIFKKEKVDQAVSILKNKNTIQQLMDDIARNYDLIQKVNADARIFEICFPIPKLFCFSYQEELKQGMKQYLEVLQATANQYGVTYIDDGSLDTSLKKREQQIVLSILNGLCEPIKQNRSNGLLISGTGLLRSLQLARTNDYQEWMHQYGELNDHLICQEQKREEECFVKAIGTLKR